MRWTFVIGTILFLALFGCQHLPYSQTHILAEDDDYVIVMPGNFDNLESLAKRFLGDEEKAWVIADFNNISDISHDKEIVIPKHASNIKGIFSDGYQTVPILCYHRFGDNKNKLYVSPEEFYAQMKYLHDNGYRVIPLQRLVGFLSGNTPLPKKAVAITIDDGYKSAYQIAYPILRKFGFSATLFVYTDLIGASGGLQWKEMREMVDSSLIDIQPHSKTHANLALRYPDESEDAYKKRIDQEVIASGKRLRENLGVPLHSFAYPFGDTDKPVIDSIRANQYELAFTVQSGANPFFAYPFMIRRTMIFGGTDMTEFSNKLQVYISADLR